MKKLIAITAFALMCGSALAQNTGPLPQTGKDHPEVTKGAKESGAMDTTTGKNTRDNKKHMSKGAGKGDVKK
jgi:hypothetical protein